MRRLIAQILTVVSLPAAASENVSLDEYLWTARPLVIFAPSEADPRLLQQLEWLEAEEAELADRDVVVIVDVETGNGTLIGLVNLLPIFGL